ncbi:cupredoxin domain-containing protein [Cohnella yongneupensis]|uniref:Cupredoxin domain-containing protein n=1 Tax=Cohnella yongneupensis TaxID=425006 RepID=A0ABW0R6E0_9BACL
MSKIVLLDRKKLQFYGILALVVILAGAYIGWQQSRSPSVASSTSSDVQVFHLVTGEFTSKSDSGQTLESYRFDPGSITVNRNQPVELRISGINGQSHPFVIEGLGISGTVNKGKTTIVRFTPKVAGTYMIICTTHSEQNSGAPMIGYLNVV